MSKLSAPWRNKKGKGCKTLAWNCLPVCTNLFGRNLLRRFVLALHRLDNQPLPNGLGRNRNPADLAVHNRSNLLRIRLKFPLRNPGYLPTDTAKIFGLPASGNTLTGTGLFPQKETLSTHSLLPKIDCPVRPDGLFISYCFRQSPTNIGFPAAFASFFHTFFGKRRSIRFAGAFSLISFTKPLPFPQYAERLH